MHISLVAQQLVTTIERFPIKLATNLVAVKLSSIWHMLLVVTIQVSGSAKGPHAAFVQARKTWAVFDRMLCWSQRSSFGDIG